MAKYWFLNVLIIVSYLCNLVVEGYPIEDLIVSLPGQPKVEFSQYAGYVDINVKHGRSLFYYFVEADHKPQNKPLTLWLNGGPGCSSIGGGAFTELGPFFPAGDGRGLRKNSMSWNRASNLLFIESPAGVGWSYSNTTSDYNIGDASTANDMLSFFLKWFEKFPTYKSRALFLTGESYAGHYIPQLANAILDYNAHSTGYKFNLKGVAIGNPLLNLDRDAQATYDYFWSHGMISDEIGLAITKDCDFDDYTFASPHNVSASCNAAINDANEVVGDYINNYDVILDVCYPSIVEQELRLKKMATKISVGVDVCMSYERKFYFNLPEVQKALHANRTNLPYSWSMCSGVLKKSTTCSVEIPPSSVTMELSMTTTLRFGSQNHFPFPLHNYPISNTKTTLRVSAKKKSTIEGISDELNSIASLNLDHAPSRRHVRQAFTHLHQQLDHILFKTAPAGIITQEWYEKNSRGLEIFCKSWMPEHGVPIKGALFFCHGYGSTCTFFFEGIARRIAASGFGVYAMDFPGFGLSEGLHGYIPSFDDLVDDVIEYYTKIKARPEARDLPQFIFGQSMGGAIALKAHLKEPNVWDGVILVAPMCKISEGMLPPTTILKALTLLSKMMPKAKLFPYKDLSELIFREPSKRKLAVYNVISYDDQTRLRTGMELLSATQDIESQLEKVSAPLLILHGAEDKVTDPLVSQFLYEKASSKDKTLKIYEGGYHGILEGEPDERISSVHNDIISWLDNRCSR